MWLQCDKMRKALRHIYASWTGVVVHSPVSRGSQLGRLRGHVCGCCMTTHYHSGKEARYEQQIVFKLSLTSTVIGKDIFKTCSMLLVKIFLLGLKIIYWPSVIFRVMVSLVRYVLYFYEKLIRLTSWGFKFSFHIYGVCSRVRGAHAWAIIVVHVESKCVRVCDCSEPSLQSCLL